MSSTLHVLLPATSLPTTAGWQFALDVLRLPVTLTPTFSPGDKSGSCTATLRDRPPVTFEFHLSPARDLVARYPGLRGMFPARDLVATFRFGPDPTESACALCCLAALAHLTDSPFFNPAEGTCSAPDAALTLARSSLPPSP